MEATWLLRCMRCGLPLLLLLLLWGLCVSTLSLVFPFTQTQKHTSVVKCFLADTRVQLENAVRMKREAEMDRQVCVQAAGGGGGALAIGGGVGVGGSRPWRENGVMAVCVNIKGEGGGGGLYLPGRETGERWGLCVCPRTPCVGASCCSCLHIGTLAHWHIGSRPHNHSATHTTSSLAPTSPPPQLP